MTGVANLIVETRSGAIQGCHTGISVFFGGIPYAGAVSGQARFKPPQNATSWDGVRPAVYPGPVICQNPTRFDPFLGPDPQPQSEDALVLNVWTPAPDGNKRPVYVWIHGGAYVSGSGSFPLYDGARFAAYGDIVCVSINYRLGERGYGHFAHLDESYAGSGNNALKDQLQALRWVRDNIERFGGDPDQVTVGGQSAGAGSITGLMMMDDARGLFHRAIIQSIALMSFRDVELAEWASTRFMKELGAASIAEIEQAPISDLLAAQRATMRARPPWKKVAFQPVVDGQVLKRDILPAARAGAMADIPLLIGTTTDEWNPFRFFMDPATLPGNGAELERFVDQAIGDGGQVIEAYREAHGGLETSALFNAIVSDWRWWRPTLRLVEILCSRQPVWLYEFAWKSPAHDGALGAGHCVDLPFCFDNLATPSTPYLVGTDPPRKLAQAMHASWCAFIRSGDPAVDDTGRWPRYDTEHRAVMKFDNETASVRDPRAGLRTFWQERDRRYSP
jgi:para-nitrobenzyl esterase